MNDIKEGAIIDNTNKYISTAGGPEYSSSYANGNSFGQGYMLKIKVPKGTKVVDMRIADPSMDEFTLQPHKLKVTSLDYETGVVECEYIPVE